MPKWFVCFFHISFKYWIALYLPTGTTTLTLDSFIFASRLYKNKPTDINTVNTV